MQSNFENWKKVDMIYFDNFQENRNKSKTDFVKFI
jgi:hypothetical protein